jgi:IS30 family transposase
MGRPGRKRRLVLEDEYWKLIRAGVGTVEACRRLGIGRTTGYYWRAQRGGLPRTVLAEDSRSGRFLSLPERERIAVLREQGCGVRDIAGRLGRSPSTISRELRRNITGGDDGVYRPGLAHSRARERARRTRRGIFARLPELRSVVQAKLELQWSPEQIAAWLRRAYPARPEWHVCHETIYQGLYFGGADGLSRQFTRHLRTGRALRRPRRTSTAREPRFTVASVSIRDRPAAVLERSRVGDFEGDLIVGSHGRSVIGTLVDRNSRYLRLVHVPTGLRDQGWRGGVAFAAALAAAVAGLPARARLSLTWDQGVEMARHDLVAHLFPDGIYFADAGRPWQRGTNENTNGLLRQYLPRSADLSTFTRDDLDRVEQLMNNRPRKTLDWATPAQVFTAGAP